MVDRECTGLTNREIVEGKQFWACSKCKNVWKAMGNMKAGLMVDIRQDLAEFSREVEKNADLEQQLHTA